MEICRVGLLPSELGGATGGGWGCVVAGRVAGKW